MINQSPLNYKWCIVGYLLTFGLTSCVSSKTKVSTKTDSTHVKTSVKDSTVKEDSSHVIKEETQSWWKQDTTKTKETITIDSRERTTIYDLATGKPLKVIDKRVKTTREKKEDRHVDESFINHSKTDAVELAIETKLREEKKDSTQVKINTNNKNKSSFSIGFWLWSALILFFLFLLWRKRKEWSLWDKL